METSQTDHPTAFIKALLSRAADMPEDQITDEARLFEDLGLDSMEAIKILSEAEDSLGVSVPDDDVLTLRTVGEAIAYFRTLCERTH